MKSRKSRNEKTNHELKKRKLRYTRVAIAFESLLLTYRSLSFEC